MRSACKLCARQARLLLHQSQQQQLISGQAAPSTTLRRWQSTATSPRKASVQQPESSASTSSSSSLSGLLSRFTPSSSSSSSADDAQPNNFKINLVNPAKLLGGELASMRSNIQKLLGSGRTRCLDWRCTAISSSGIFVFGADNTMSTPGKHHCGLHQHLFDALLEPAFTTLSHFARLLLQANEEDH